MTRPFPLVLCWTISLTLGLALFPPTVGRCEDGLAAKTVTLDLTGAQLSTVLASVAREAKVAVVASEDVAALDRPWTIKATDATVGEVLDALGLKWQADGGAVVVAGMRSKGVAVWRPKRPDGKVEVDIGLRAYDTVAVVRNPAGAEAHVFAGILGYGSPGQPIGADDTVVVFEGQSGPELMVRPGTGGGYGGGRLGGGAGDGQVVYILGAVRAPGAYHFEPALTVSKLLAMAGGVGRGPAEAGTGPAEPFTGSEVIYDQFGRRWVKWSDPGAEPDKTRLLELIGANTSPQGAAQWALPATVIVEGPLPPAVADERVTVEAKDAKVGDVLQMLSQASHQRITLAPGVRSDTTVTLNIEDMPFLSALRSLLASAGLRAQAQWEGQTFKGLLVLPGAGTIAHEYRLKPVEPPPVGPAQP